jgi:hypothetical protein
MRHELGSSNATATQRPPALIVDYVDQVRRLDQIPMA